MSGGRVGLGFDIHPFAAAESPRPLILGGVVIPDAGGLAGHSDADVVAHAVADALLGAAGQGDLGSHFPDTDPRWRGADSMALLAEVVSLVAEAGWAVTNVHANLVAEVPRLSPYRQGMEDRLSAVLAAPAAVTLKRAEQIGALGRAEGMACWAVGLLERR